MLIQPNSRYYLFRDSLSTAWCIHFLEGGLDHCLCSRTLIGRLETRFLNFNLSETIYSNFTFAQSLALREKWVEENRGFINGVEEPAPLLVAIFTLHKESGAGYVLSSNPFCSRSRPGPAAGTLARVPPARWKNVGNVPYWRWAPQHVEKPGLLLEKHQAGNQSPSLLHCKRHGTYWGSPGGWEECAGSPSEWVQPAVGARVEGLPRMSGCWRRRGSASKVGKSFWR